MRPHIAFVTGGYSGEAAISYESAKTITTHLDRDRYEVFTIDLRPDGWWHTTAGGDRVAVDKNDFSLHIGNRHVRFDAAFLGIHGSPGEDGRLQGYLDLVRIPYTSCDAATSALTFNKRFTVAVVAMGGIRVANSVLLIKDQFDSPETVIRNLRFPVFVKPNNGGSSIGVSKVENPSEELGTAIEKAFREDSEVLVEEFIEGRELTIGVLRKEGQIVTLPITEIISKNAFFDYEAKYQGKSEEVTPADVPAAVTQKIRDAARRVYQVCNCRGIVRIDFIYNEEAAEPFFLEVNTVPGQSEASVVPQQVRAMGWSLKDFYTYLIDEALSRK